MTDDLIVATADAVIATMVELKAALPAREAGVDEIKKSLDRELNKVPNDVHASVPVVSAAYRPAAHAVQKAACDAPTTVPYAPAAHAVQPADDVGTVE